MLTVTGMDYSEKSSEVDFQEEKTMNALTERLILRGW